MQPGGFARSAAAAVALSALGACLGAGPGACGTAEARAFTEIEHYGGRSPLPRDHSFGVCVASFSDEDPVDDVIGHYRVALAAEGWEIHDDGGGYALAAQRGGLQVTISAAPEDTGGRRYELLLGEAPPLEGD